MSTNYALIDGITWVIVLHYYRLELLSVVMYIRGALYQIILDTVRFLHISA